MLILHRSRMAPEMKQNHLLFWSFSGSSSCIRHANYIHICAFSKEHRGDNEAILSVASAGRLLNTFHWTSQVSPSAEPEEKTRYQAQVHQLWLMPPHQMLLDARTLAVTVLLSPQPEQGRYRVPTTARSGGKPWKKAVAASRDGSSISCHASGSGIRACGARRDFAAPWERAVLLRCWLKV